MNRIFASELLTDLDTEERLAREGRESIENRAERELRESKLFFYCEVGGLAHMLTLILKDFRTAYLDTDAEGALKRCFRIWASKMFTQRY